MTPGDISSFDHEALFNLIIDFFLFQNFISLIFFLDGSSAEEEEERLSDETTLNNHNNNNSKIVDKSTPQVGMSKKSSSNDGKTKAKKSHKTKRARQEEENIPIYIISSDESNDPLQNTIVTEEEEDEGEEEETSTSNNSNNDTKRGKKKKTQKTPVEKQPEASKPADSALNNTKGPLVKEVNKKLIKRSYVGPGAMHNSDGSHVHLNRFSFNKHYYPCCLGNQFGTKPMITNMKQKLILQDQE